MNIDTLSACRLETQLKKRKLFAYDEKKIGALLHKCDNDKPFGIPPTLRNNILRLIRRK